MRSPDHYLKDLLFEYDCVIIPGVGGFIMQSGSARINRVKRRIHPPSRYPSFNSLLVHDDGLLTSRIAREGNMSYSEAGKIVGQFAVELKNILARGEKVSLSGLGDLSAGREGAIIFIPDYSINYHSEVFGMTSASLYPLAIQTDKTRTFSKPVDRKGSAIRKKKPASVRWTLALSLPVILFLIYGIIFPGSVLNIYTNYSGIVIDLFHKQEITPVKTMDVMDIKSARIQEQAPEHEQDIIHNPVTINTPVTEPAITAISTSVDQSPVKYYIIGGCFEKQENADKFLSVLIEKGYKAERAGRTKKGHSRISYGSFPEKEAALSFLRKIREEANPGAWLLKF